MTEPKIRYDIEAGVSGQRDVDDLAKTIEGLGRALEGDLRAQAEASAQALRDLGAQQQAVDTVRSLGLESLALRAQLDSAAASVDQLSAAQAAAASNAQVMAQAEGKAALEAEVAGAALQTMRQALADLRAGSEQAARGTDEYRASVEQARSTIAELRQQVDAKQAALAQAREATRSAAAEEKNLGNQYDAAVLAAGKASVAVADNQRALDKARDASRALGIDTSQLADEQKRLDGALQDARQGMDGIAIAAGKMRERLDAAAKVQQAFIADVRKLGLEGPQAPAGLEEAFRRLGINGVSKAEAAVRDLQVALAQVRNAPDVLPKDKEAAVAAFNRRVAELKNEAGRAATATGQLGQAAGGAGDALGRAARQAAAWATALVGLNQLKSLAGHVIETGAAFENLEVRLGNLLGGSEAAADAMGMLKDLAASTPYSVQDMAESFAKLTAFGLRPTEQQMRSLADVASNLGGGTEALAGITLALGQAWSKGKLQGEEMMQMAERGVPVWDALASATGRTVPELQKMASAGKLGRDAIKALIDELGRMNAGASTELMSTYAGAVSNAKDALEEFFGMAADAGVLDWLSAKIRELLKEFDRMKNTGELQAAAKDIADGFIAVAEVAEAVTRTLIDMAPAIEAATKVWLAFKAVNIVQTLYGIAAGTAVAAPGLVATAAGAHGAAAGMTTAAGAATALGLAMKRLLAATGVGVLLVALGELGLRLLGVGEDAKKAGEDIDAAFAPPTENGPALAADEAAPKLANMADQAGRAATEMARLADVGQFSGDKLRQAFDAAIKAGKDADEALRGIGREFDLSKVPGIQNATVVLDGLLQDGRITAEQFRAAWDQALEGVDLSTFELNARAALEGTWQGVGRLQDALDAGLREAIRRSGAEFEVLAGGMSKASASALNDTDTIIAGMGRLKAQGVDTAAALTASLGKGIQTADSQKALDALKERIERVRDVLGERVADALLQQIADQAAKASKALGGLGDALGKLGVTSDADLKKAAQSTRELYETVRTAGGSAREQAEAFQKMAEAAVRSGDSGAIAYAKSQAAVHGFEVAVDQAGKTAVKRMGDAVAATGGYGKAIQGATQDVQEHVGWLDRMAKRNAEVGKLPPAGRKAHNGEELGEGVTEIGSGGQYRNRSGFASDAKGNALVAGGDLNSLTGIANFLRAAGLNDEQAKRLALEFSDGKGNIPYAGNPGQKRYGGDTLSMALLRAAERITFAGIPVGGGSANAQREGPSRTVTVNLNLDGNGVGPINTDEDGERSITAFIDQLKRDKKRSVRR